MLEQPRKALGQALVVLYVVDVSDLTVRQPLILEVEIVSTGACLHGASLGELEVTIRFRTVPRRERLLNTTYERNIYKKARD